MIIRPTLFVLLAVAMALPVRAADPVSVTAKRLGDLLVDKELRAPASVISANRAVVTSQVAALIDQVVKDVGDDVQKGELLIRLDDDNARYALAQAKAALAAIDAQVIEAKSRLTNAEELLGKNFISDEELIARQAALAVLEANRQGQLVAINVAELDFARTRIKAPFDAAVVERQAQVGSYAQPGTALITLVQTNNREVDAEIDPRYIQQLPNVEKLRFVSQGTEWPVTLARVSSVIEPSTRVVRGRFVFTEESAPIGASGQLVWSALSGVLPVNLIVQRGDAFGVFEASSDTAKFVSIPGAQQGRPAAISLPADTLIIVRGHRRLQDGDTISLARE